jgi:hypothetical protein
MTSVTPLLLSFLLLVGSPAFNFSHPIPEGDNTTDFSPHDMVLGDDAFHGRGNLPFTEWWYFDAMFDNGYSVQMSVLIVSMAGRGYVFQRLDIHYNSTLIADRVESYPFTDLSASSEIPFVQIQGKTVLVGTQNTTTGNFEYNVSFEYPGYAALLHYVGCTQGWKGQQITGDWWAVALPRANVTGEIIVDNQTVPVNGTGYHDHNWEITAKAVLRFGWFWGKFDSADYTATWAALLPNRVIMNPLLVLNQRNGGYLAVPPEAIWFSVDDFNIDHFMLIPYFFTIAAMTDKVFLLVNMTVINVDYKRDMGFIQYWRFHVKCSGIIFIDGHAETVDGVFIAEHLRFR